MGLEFTELAGYTQGERDKWRPWFDAHAAALQAPVQPGGRFPAVWDLLDHIFLVEARHTLRILSQPVIDQTGAARGDLPALWQFADSTRAILLDTVRGLTDTDSSSVREFGVRDQIFRLTPRKLVFHILLHEVRHFAQIAVAVRNAGFAPPGEHDFFYTQSAE